MHSPERGGRAWGLNTPDSGLYGEAPLKGLSFQALGMCKGRDYMSCSIPKGRENYHLVFERANQTTEQLFK